MSTPQHLSPLLGAWMVTKKELTESLRDRATVIYAFVLPICMYPVMFWVMLQGALVLQGQNEKTEVTLGIAAAGVPALEHTLATEALTVALADSLPEGSESAASDAEPTQANPLQLAWATKPLDLAQAEDWLLTGNPGDSEIDAGVAAAPDAVLFLEPLTLLHTSTKSASNLARERARARIQKHATSLRLQAARAAGLDPADLEPIKIVAVDLAERGAKGAVVLASLLPLMLVVMAVLGSFFPAVDLTAGEKERGTSETTLLLPLPRSSIITGKILAVGTLSMTATALSLFALGLSAENLLAGVASKVDVKVAIPTIALFGAIPLSLFFSLFVSAVLTACASLAATFKEGQALLGPVQMVFMLPAMIGIIPGIQLNYTWALVPIVNVVLAFRALLMGQTLIGPYCVTAVALCFYAWLALRLALHLLSRESVQLAGKTLPLARLFKTLRSTSSTR